MIKDNNIFIKRKQILLALITYKHYNNFMNKKKKKRILIHWLGKLP